MATKFRIGQRVRVVWAIAGIECVGSEATIDCLPGTNDFFSDCYGVKVDGHPAPVFAPYNCWWGTDKCFAPLTSPSADSEWAAESLRNLVRKVSREPLPLTEKQLSEVRGA